MSRSRRHRPISPFPQEHGIDAMRVSMPMDGAWTTVRDHLVDRFTSLTSDQVDGAIAAGDVATTDGRAITAQTKFIAGQLVFVRRAFEPEPVVPFDIPVVHEDARILVVDKPPFLATMPRGAHITQTAVARLRVQLDIPTLSPAHRLDRLTSGLLLLTKEPHWRGAYQQVFAARRIEKTYLALAPAIEGFERWVDIRLHLAKEHGVPAAHIDADHPQPNAHTMIRRAQDIGDNAVYELRPVTGRTHQLRATMGHVGAPIIGDPLYPQIVHRARDDFSVPLQLLAHSLAFEDPVTRRPLQFTSRRAFPLENTAAQ